MGINGHNPTKEEVGFGPVPCLVQHDNQHDMEKSKLQPTTFVAAGYKANLLYKWVHNLILQHKV